MDCSTNVAVHIAVNTLSATATKTAILEVAFEVVAEAAITAVGEMTIAAVTVIAALRFGLNCYYLCYSAIFAPVALLDALLT